MPARPVPAPALPLGAAHAECAPQVITRRGRRTLEFVPGEVQSAMLVARPDALVLSYCRAIMCFALFVPRPRHIIMVGLGGGSLVKFCYRHFPDVRLTVVELRADVIALRRQFCVPDDDARLCVVQADASTWMAQQGAVADVIIVDGFDAHGLPAALGTARFYRHCRRALRDGGVLCTNSFSYDPAFASIAARLGRTFDERVCWFDKVAGNNRIMFAIKAMAPCSPLPGRGLRLQRQVARHNGLGSGLLNRALAMAVVGWLSRRKCVQKCNIYTLI